MGIIGNNKYKENERMYLAIDMTMGRDDDSIPEQASQTRIDVGEQ